MTYEEFIQYFDVKRKGANSCQVICPSHTDNKPSLTISRGRVHPVVMKCHAGCNNEDILRAVGLSLKDMLNEH